MSRSPRHPVGAAGSLAERRLRCADVRAVVLSAGHFRDDVGMNLFRSPLLVLFVVAATALSACGSSSNSASQSTTSGSGVTAAKQKCLDATKKIENSTARSTAEQACNQISTSNATVNAALSDAKQTCLTAAAKIPIASVKQAAEGECKKIAP